MGNAAATWSRRALDHLEVANEAAALVDVTGGDVRTWSWGDLAARTSGAVDALDAADVDTGAVVPALLTSRPEAVALVLAGAFSRRPVAPLAPRLTARELAACLEPIDGPVLVTEPQWLDLATEVAARTGKRVAVYDEPARGTATLRAPNGPDDVAFVLHTSGTTGRPKPVVVRERAMSRRCDVIGGLYELDADSRLVTAALFHHVAGIGQMAAALAHGSAVVMVPSFTVDGWRSLAAMHPTHALLVPTAIEMLLGADALAVPSLRVVAYGTAPIHPMTARRMQETMPQVRLLNLFGQTEGTPLTALTPEDHRLAVGGRERLLSSVGRPAPGVELRLNDVDSDGIGEVWGRSAHGFLVDEHGWQRTGDLGRIDDGYLYLVGRMGDKIVRGGENVLPLEVEQILETHPGVAAAGVVGRPDQRLGETVVAFVVPTDVAAPPDPEDLRTHCRIQLAGFKVPVDYQFVDALPRNPIGKLLRHELRRLATQATTVKEH